MDPFALRLTLYRRSWDSPLLQHERFEGAIYSEYEEEYRYRYCSDEPELRGIFSGELVEKRGTGRRFEYLGEFDREEYLRTTPHEADINPAAPYVRFVATDGTIAVSSPTNGKVFVLKEIVND